MSKEVINLCCFLPIILGLIWFAILDHWAKQADKEFEKNKRKP